MSEKNLPSEYADFEQFTREIVRQISPYVVLLSRREYNKLVRPETPELNSLTSAISIYEAQLRYREARARGENPSSIPPPPPERSK